jgi:Tol biopolymer transport system component
MSTFPLRPLRRLAVVALLAGAACADSVPDAIGPTDIAEPSFAKGGPNQLPSSGGRIFFSGFLTGNYDLFSVNPDGTDLRRLTYDIENEAQPSVSPDGRKIAYLKQRAGTNKSDLWIMNADGSRPQLRVAVPDDVFSFYAPVWSPDGRTITYTYQSLSPLEMRLASVGAKSGAPLTLGAIGGYATWSPDGQYLAYTKPVGNTRQLFTSRPDGSDLVQRTTFDICCGVPRWSPDGNRVLLVARSGSDPAPGLYAANVVDGPAWSKLAGTASPGYVDWSPDGARIVFGDSSGDLWVTLANGGGAGVVLDDAQAVLGVSWSP